MQADEAALMTEWRTCWQEKHAEYPYFNEDGIADYELWFTLPDGKHILVVLKETNGLQGSLVEFLRHDGNGKTWNNVVRWAKMALDGVYLENISQNEFQNIIRSIAVINLKKYAGGTRANALVVSMPHPNRSAKSWTLELEKVLRITGRLEPKNTRNAGIP